MMAHYGKFNGVENYIALVTVTHGKSAVEIGKGEKLACIIALGYGDIQGAAHQNKPVGQLCNGSSDMPDWFSKGMEAALLLQDIRWNKDSYGRCGK